MRLIGVVSCFAVLASLGGCVTAQGGAAPQGANITPISVPPLTIIVPNDPAMQPSYRNTPYYSAGFNAVNPACDIGGRAGNFFRILKEGDNGSSFVVHYRHDNCVAGSGVKFNVNYKLTQSDQNFTMVLQPTGRTTYQQGLIMPFPVPSVSESDLIQLFEEPVINYQMEANSAYNKDSVFANFARLATRITDRDGGLPDIKHKDWFSIKINGKMVKFSVEVYPYRDGSKVVISALIPAIETSPSTVDFKEVFNIFRARISDIVNS